MDVFLILEENRITDNYVRADLDWALSGGADIWNTSARIVGNVFERDTVVGVGFGAGGGLSFNGDDSTYPAIRGNIRGNIFRANTINSDSSSAWGGGMYVSWTGEVTILENLFQGNSATSATSWAAGGGLMTDDGNSSDGSILGLGRKSIIRNRVLNNPGPDRLTNALLVEIELGGWEHLQ
jgi:hypothetical protein